ncbi:MAG TPA: LysR substrate-binding domain-containing protein [Usitatibacter sp.]|nr:LysR substrate-binding domain-containing protein [Usitatibacter sp.]
MFELSQLRCFVAVGEELHFRRAAERLNMTQPPLSRQIRLLEHQVGTPLLERTNRVVRFTAAGRAFFPEATRILRLAEEAATSARRIAKAEGGSIAVGFTASFGYGLLPDIVRRLHRRVPSLSLTLKEMVTGAQIEALASGRLDVGLLRPHAPHGALESVLLGRDALMLAVPRAEARKWPKQPTLSCLDGRRLISYSPYEASYFYQLVHAHLARAHVTPEIVDYVPQIHTMLALVDSGIGVAIIPETASRLHFEGVTLRRIETTPARPVEMIVSYRKDNDNPILKVFRGEVKEALKAHVG